MSDDAFKPAARTWSKMIGAALGASVITLAIQWLGLLDIPDRWLDQNFTGFMNDYVSVPFAADRIALIVADAGANRSLGEFSEEWRPKHAELIDALVKAGATVVAFDIDFEKSDRYGEELRAAIDRASGSATKVVLGMGDFHADLQNPKPKTMSALQDLPAENWAMAETGLGPKKSGLNESGYLSRLLLALHPNKQPDQRPNVRNISVVPSLALQAFTHAEAGGRRFSATFVKEDRAIQLRDESSQVIKSISVLDDQRDLANQMDVIVGMVDQAELDRVSVPYYQVYDSLNDERYLKRTFAGKIVLIGVKKDDDRWQVSANQSRYGFEIHATAISDLLEGVSVRPLRWGGHFAAILLMCAVALAAQTVLSKWTGPSLALKKLPFVPVEVESEMKIPFLVIILLAVYLVSAFLIYKSLHLILNITYHATALLLAYTWIGFIKKRSRPKTV